MPKRIIIYFVTYDNNQSVLGCVVKTNVINWDLLFSEKKNFKVKMEVRVGDET